MKSSPKKPTAEKSSAVSASPRAQQTSPTKSTAEKSSSVSDSVTPLKLYYFNIKARNYIAVVLAQAANLPIELIKVDDMSTIKDKLPFGQLPYLEHGDICIAQSGAIQRYIAKIGHLEGDSIEDFAKSEQLLAQAEDLWVGMAKTNGNNDAMNEYFEGDWKTQCSYLEKLIPDGEKYFIPSKRVAGGYAIASMLEIANCLDPSALESFPKLAAFYAEMVTSPAFEGIKDWPMYLNRGSPITVAYWDIRGLGAPLRMQVMYSQMPLACVTYHTVVDPITGESDSSSWFNSKPDLKAINPLINLPYIKDGEKLITQTNACILYISRKLKMLGSNEDELIKCEELLSEAMDLRNQIVKFAYSDKGISKEEFEIFLNSISGNLDKFNLCKESNIGPYFVGVSASGPDFHIYELLDQLKVMAKVHSLDDIFKKYSALECFHSDFGSLTKNQKYLQSKLSLLPLNNKSASIGSAPGGGKFDKSMETTWNNCDGIY